jgi:hypothetical protein
VAKTRVTNSEGNQRQSARLLRFVQIEPFARLWSQCRLTEEDLRYLEWLIIEGPDAGVVIPGAAGLRKMRFAPLNAVTGKRGAYRVFYVVFHEYGTALLMAVIAKTDKADLSTAERKALAQYIGELKSRYEKGLVR